jgi:ParB/RepB/Spo0J family partition protein
VSVAHVLAHESQLIAISMAVDALDVNPNQPRETIDEGELGNLTASVRAKGRLIQPLVARPLPSGRYEIVCGERRWRAAKAAGLSEVSVVVRELSDEEAFEESLVENIQREGMVPLDEARAVARLATAHGVQEAARRLGKPHHWVSKRKRIAEAPAFVVDFVARGSSGDVEAFYELTKLADVDPDAAQNIVDNHAQGGHLRDEVKAAARAGREDDHDDSVGERRGQGYTSPGFEPRLSDARGGSSSDEDEDREESEDAGAGDDAIEAKASWLPSDAPELDRPFEGDPPLLVVAVEVRRAGHFVLTTSTGTTTYEFSAQARAQLRELLGPS